MGALPPPGAYYLRVIMSILKANILTRVNLRLQTAETDIDTQIQEILDDLSEEDLLVRANGGDYTISSITATDILATGDVTPIAAVGDTIRISGCSVAANNTTWVISNITYVAPTTTITTTLPLTIATDGTLHIGPIISNGDLTLDEPVGFRSMIAISLNINASNSKQEPLIKLPQGHRQYQELRHNDDATGIPRYFSHFNGKFYFWRPPGQDFTALVEYYKNHPQDVDNIEFGDIFRNTIYAGATFKVALEKGRDRMIQLWGTVYQDAKQKRIDSTVFQPHIVRG